MTIHRSGRALGLIAPLACALACGPGNDVPITEEDAPPDDTNAPPSNSPTDEGTVPSVCRPESQAWSDVERLHAAARDSLARLPQFSEKQIRLIRSMMGIMLASNEQFFHDPADYTKLVDLAKSIGVDVTVPFDPAPDGSWAASLPNEPDSRLTLEFFAPGDTRPLQGDVFDLDSYLGGVTVEGDHTLEEMVADPTLRATFAFSWQEERPLAYLLRPDTPIPNPLEIKVSLDDLIDMAYGGGTEFDDPGDPAFGPLFYLMFIEMSSRADVVDEVNGVKIHYAATTDRKEMGLVAEGALGFTVDLDASLGDYALTLRDAKLDYRGDLRGNVRFHLSGPGIDLDVDTAIRSLEGCPASVWSCAASGEQGAEATCSSAAWDDPR